MNRFSPRKVLSQWFESLRIRPKKARWQSSRTRSIESLEVRTLFSEDHTLLDPTGSAWGFGQSVATSETWTVVGSPQADDQGFSRTGLAYVFDSSGALAATLHNPAPGNDDNFGYSVAVAVDGNTVVIGVVNDNSGAGSAYLYDATREVSVLAAGRQYYASKPLDGSLVDNLRAKPRSGNMQN